MAPLSAIPWLEELAATPPSDQQPNEAPVADGAAAPQVTATPLDPAAQGGVGLLPQATSGLPPDLWSRSQADQIARAFDALPDVLPLPLADLRLRLLLAEASAPAGAAGDAFLLTRTSVLTRLGALPQAQALLDQASPLTPAVFARAADVALLTGESDAACGALSGQPHLSDDLGLRVFCLARGQDWSAAALTLQSASVIGALDDRSTTLLAQFLEPDLADDGPPPVGDGEVSPLDFRLYEAIGAPLSTADLPRPFAAADLSPNMGWKAQLDAAERLAATGAIEPNQLLGLYTQRIPAASGGVWDRAEAIQRLDRALATRDPGAIGTALPRAEGAMAAVGLDAAFARMFAPRLTGSLPLAAAPAAVRARVLLLSPDYERAADLADAPGFAAAVALGDTDAAVAATPLEAAIAPAFGLDIPQSDLQSLAAEGELGLAILTAMRRISEAREGDISGLGGALGFLRSVGLEDTARQSALSLLLDGT